MEYLSFSPSLIPILCFLERKDLCQCRLVSRRFHLVIISHRYIKPKKDINVSVRHLKKGDSNDCIVVDIYKRKDITVSIEIENDSISMLIDRDQQLVEYAYKEPLSTLPVSSLQDGLRVVLTPLFRNFFIFHLNIEDKSPQPFFPFISTVANIFTRIHRDVSLFRTMRPNDLNRILSSCTQLRFQLGACKHFVLPPELHIHRDSLVFTVPSVVETICTMTDFFKGWYEGRYRMPRLDIFNGGGEGKSEKLTSLQLNKAFPFTYERKSFVKDFGDNLTLSYSFFRRPHDNFVLGVGFYSYGNHVYIYDFEYFGPLEEVTFLYVVHF